MIMRVPCKRKRPIEFCGPLQFYSLPEAQLKTTQMPPPFDIQYSSFLTQWETYYQHKN